MDERFKQSDGEEELLQRMVRQKICALLEKISDTSLLERVYRFAQYIYIHRS